MAADPGAGHSGPPASGSAPQEAVEVRRSARRRSTVSAYRDGDRTIVLLPARMSAAEEKRWVAVLLERLAARERRRRPSDEDLVARARDLSGRYLEGRARPAGVRWVDNQNTRWGSCTPGDGTIRLSSRLKGMPEYVVDYVLLHELAHLLVPGHGPAFWDLLSAYPRTERARGYLEGAAAAGARPDGHSADDDGLPGQPVGPAGDGDPWEDGRASATAAGGPPGVRPASGRVAAAKAPGAEAARDRTGRGRP